MTYAHNTGCVPSAAVELRDWHAATEPVAVTCRKIGGGARRQVRVNAAIATSYPMADGSCHSSVIGTGFALSNEFLFAKKLHFRHFV